MVYKNITYSTLRSVVADRNVSDTCHGWAGIVIPNGWGLAYDSPDTRMVAASHGFSSSYINLAYTVNRAPYVSFKGIHTKNAPKAGSYFRREGYARCSYQRMPSGNYRKYCYMYNEDCPGQYLIRKGPNIHIHLNGHIFE